MSAVEEEAAVREPLDLIRLALDGRLHVRSARASERAIARIDFGFAFVPVPVPIDDDDDDDDDSRAHARVIHDHTTAY